MSHLDFVSVIIRYLYLEFIFIQSGTKKLIAKKACNGGSDLSPDNVEKEICVDVNNIITDIYVYLF